MENGLTYRLIFVSTAWLLTAACAMGKKKGRRRGAWRGTQKTKEGGAGAGVCRAGSGKNLRMAGNIT